jgi:hypothetical protein
MRSAGNFNSEWGYLAPAPTFMRTVRVVLVATAIGATAGAAVVLSLIDRPSAQRDRTASITAHAIVTSVRAAPAMVAPPVYSAAAALAAPVAVKPAAATAQVQQSPAPAALQAASKPTLPAVPLAAPQMTQQVGSHATPQMAPQVAMAPPPVAAPAPAVAAPDAAIKTSLPETPAARDAVVAPAPRSASGFASLSDVPRASEVAPDKTSDQALIPPQTVPPEKRIRHHTAYASNGKSRPPPGLGSVLRQLFSPHR